MTKPFKVAIVRARHDTTAALIPDQTCIDLLMTGSRSVMRFWTDTTGGYFDFLDSAMFPWVDVSLAAGATDRATQATTAFDAIRAREPGRDPLAGFNGAVVLTHPGAMAVPNPKFGEDGEPATIVAGFDGGSTVIGKLPVSVLPAVSSDHTFMCHELGHTLGFEHSYGLDNNGTDWNPDDEDIIVGPEYGSPYDLMSSGAFGSRWQGSGPVYSANPTFTGPAVAGWPFAGVAQMGPNISRANLHRWFPEALANRVIDRAFPGAGETGEVRLAPASSRSDRTRLALHPPGEPASGVGRVYVEYRDTNGWDKGLDVAGADLAQAGVVVHTLDEVAGVGPRVWYRGAIPLGSIDTDLQVATRPIVLTLEKYQDEEGARWVDISYRQSASRAVVITTANASDDIVGGQPIRAERTPCGADVTYGSWSTQSFCQFRVSTTGFGGSGAPAPTTTWTVAGTLLSPGRGTVDVAFEGAEFSLEYVIDPVSYELGLSARGGERYTAALVATVLEAGGGASASASATFNSLGYFEGYPPEDRIAVAACLAEVVERHRIPLPQRFRKPDPDPGPDPDAELWQERALREIRDDVRIEGAAAEALAQIVALQSPR